MSAPTVPAQKGKRRYGSGRREPVTHVGRVAQEMHALSGLSATYCQKLLANNRLMKLAGLVIEGHVRAGELGPTFVERTAPIEIAMARVPAEAYCAQIEIAEQLVDGAEDVEQVRYQADPTDENASRRIRTNEAAIARLWRVNRSLAARHGLRL